MSELDKLHKHSTHNKKLGYSIDEDDNMSTIDFLMVAMYFLSLFIVFYFFQKTLMGFFALFCLYLLFASAAFLVPISLYRKKFTMSFYEFSFLNILGLAPILTALFLLLNFQFSYDEYTESHKIVKRYVDKRDMVLLLENQAYEEEDFLRTFEEHEMQSKGAWVSDSLHLTFAEGILGYRVLKKKDFN